MQTILILLPYYNRPTLVKNALNSLKTQAYKNWKLAFIDDGSEHPGRPIVESLFDSEDLERTTFYSTEDSREKKLEQGGSRYPQFLNKALTEIEADVAIFLCDDDALYEDYLENLNRYHTNNPNVVYCYGHVIPFNPQKEAMTPLLGKRPFPHNHTHDLMACNHVDASQVSWKIKPTREAGVMFNDIQTANLDASLYQQLDLLFGPCQYNGFISQYKGWFPGQLGNRVQQNGEHYHTDLTLIDK